MKIEGHEPLDVWRDALKLCLVGEDVLRLGERRDEVGLESVQTTRLRPGSSDHLKVKATTSSLEL